MEGNQTLVFINFQVFMIANWLNVIQHTGNNVFNIIWN